MLRQTTLALLLAASGGLSLPAQAEPVVTGPDPLYLRRNETVDHAAYSYEPITLRNSRTPAGVFNGNMLFLADQLDRNSERESAKRPIVITSFSNLNDLADTSPLGRLIGEQLMHELKVRGWNVIDLRMTREITVNEIGEFSLSRDIKKLREGMPAGSEVTGTYLQTKDGILVSARAIDLASGHVLSSAQTRIPRDAFVMQLVDKPAPLPMLKITR